MVYPCNGVLLCNKKEKKPADLCYNMDEPHKYYADWKKSYVNN